MLTPDKIVANEWRATYVVTSAVMPNSVANVLKSVLTWWQILCGRLLCMGVSVSFDCVQDLK